MAKTIKNKKALQKVAPEELEAIWDEEAQEAWTALEPKQQSFLLAWLNLGLSGPKAYREVYNPNANDNTARSSASRTLSNVNIQTICSKISESKKSDLIKIKNVFDEGMEAVSPVFAGEAHVGDFEDHKTRILAANSLAKLDGFLMEKPSGDLNITGDVTIQNAVLSDLNQYLTTQGREPIKQTVAPIQTQEPVKAPEKEVNFRSHGGDIEII